MKACYILSITWGKSCNYLPASVEPIRWDGNASITGGQLLRADLLHYEYKAWCQNKEVSEPLPLSQPNCAAWRSAVSTGGLLTLEGLRLFVSAEEYAVITLDFSHALMQFCLCDLIEKENLRFHVGSKYGGMPVDVFLGPDARPRLSKLAGVRVKMGSDMIHSIHFADETVPVIPDIPRLETQLCGAQPIATDPNGNPVLVENRIGAGRVWMLCVGEYWGASALDGFRKVLCRQIAVETEQTVWLTGNKTDVDYYEFRGDNYTRVVLLNTDWTSAGNRKQVTIHTNTLKIPIAVTEGAAKHLLIKGDAAIAFDVPSAIVEDFAVSQDAISVTLQGAGDVEVAVYTNRSPQPNLLRISMGAQWNSQKLQIPVA